MVNRLAFNEASSMTPSTSKQPSHRSGNADGATTPVRGACRSPCTPFNRGTPRGEALTAATPKPTLSKSCSDRFIAWRPDNLDFEIARFTLLGAEDDENGANGGGASGDSAANGARSMGCAKGVMPIQAEFKRVMRDTLLDVCGGGGATPSGGGAGASTHGRASGSGGGSVTSPRKRVLTFGGESRRFACDGGGCGGASPFANSLKVLEPGAAGRGGPATGGCLPSDFAKSTSRARGWARDRRVILDAPNLVDDFYLNLVAWGAGNVLAVALNTVRKRSICRSAPPTPAFRDPMRPSSSPPLLLRGDRWSCRRLRRREDGSVGPWRLATRRDDPL